MDETQKEPKVKIASRVITAALVCNVLYLMFGGVITYAGLDASKLTTRYYDFSPAILNYVTALLLILLISYVVFRKQFLRWEVSMSIGALSIFLAIADVIVNRIILNHPQQTFVLLRNLRYMIGTLETLSFLAVVCIFLGMLMIKVRSKIANMS